MPSHDLYKSLTAITQSILEQRGLDSVFDAITKNACSFFNASASSIMLFDEEKEYLTIAQSYNLSSEYLKVVRVHKDQEIAGKVCQAKKPRFIKDIIGLFTDISDEFTVRWATREGLISLVCAPLLLKDEPIGCLNIYYRSMHEAFDNETALDFFTRMAALAIEHSKIINQSEEKTKILTVIEEVGLVLTSSFDVDEIMTVFLPTAVLVTKVDGGGIVLFDAKEESVTAAFEYTKGMDIPRRFRTTSRLGLSISGQVFQNRKPAIADALGSEKRTNLNTQPRALAAMPLVAREKMVGILYVDAISKTNLSRSELDYLQILCSQAAIALDNTRLYQRISHEAKEMALLYEVSRSFISTLDFDRLLKNILERLKETFGYLNLAIMLVDEEKHELYPRSYINYPDNIKTLRFRIGIDGITGHVAATRKMYYSPDVSIDQYYRTGVDDARSEVCFPLMIGERLVGVLDVESYEVNGFTQDDIHMLSGLSAQIAIALENSRLYEEAKRLSLTDPLTFLPNRRNLDIFLDAEIRRALRYRRKFSVLMIDFDNFKNYNDSFGHLAGDKILKKFGQIMKETIRDVDFLGRYGGDEFIAVLPETDRTFALEVAERMRKKIHAEETEPKITLSIGIASFPTDSKDKVQLLHIADQACYEAKQLGGNCVNFASSEN